MPSPLTELTHVIEKGTHWVDAEAILAEDTFINKQPCPSGPIQGWPTYAKPVKSRPDTYTLNAVTPLDSHMAQLVTAKPIALPACSFMMVPVKLLGQHVKAAIHLAAPEQQFGEYLIIPEGLYDHWPGSTSVFRVLVGAAPPTRRRLPCGRGAFQERVAAGKHTFCRLDKYSKRCIYISYLQ